MRACSIVLACVVAVSLAGCIPAYQAPATDFGDVKFTPQPSTTASLGADIRPDKHFLPRQGSDGRSPAIVLQGLIESKNAQAWKDEYSLYATPSVDFGEFVRRSDIAKEHYSYFNVLETRIVDRDTAACRVVYHGWTTPPNGATYEITVGEPGEWWWLSKVDGVWRVNWLPRQ